MISSQLTTVHRGKDEPLRTLAVTNPCRVRHCHGGDGEAGNESSLQLVSTTLDPTDDSTFTPQLVPSQPVFTDDLERDAVFGQRVRLFGWIRERHLDVPEGEASQGFLGFAEQGEVQEFIAYSQNCSRSTTTKRQEIR